MEHPFFPTSTTRAEALQWLSVSEKLLYSRDLFGSKSLATRARDADPTLTHADQILAIVDTLIAGDLRVGYNKHDWYAILRLSPSQGRDGNLVAASYRKLLSWLNPQMNKYPYADQAFRLVVDAWTVLSNPSSKNSYDREIGVFVPMQPDPFVSNQNTFQGMAQNQNFMFFGGVGGSSGVNFPGAGVNAGGQRVDPVGPSSQGIQGFVDVGSLGGSSGVKFPGAGVNAGGQRVDRVGPSSQATQGFVDVGSGLSSGFGLNMNMGLGTTTTAYRQVSHGYSSSFAGNVVDRNEELRTNDRNMTPNVHVNVATSSENVNVNVNVNDGAGMADTNGGFGINNINVNSNGNVNFVESAENVDMNDTVPDEHEDFARTMNMDENTGNIDAATEETIDDEDISRTMNMDQNNDNIDAATEEPIEDEDRPCFWTACPYCYYMYEYPQTYIDCTLRCQNCKNAFQGVVIPSPPQISIDQESYFCCWGFLPLGFSVEVFERNKANISSWTPTIPVTEAKSAQKNSGPWVYLDDDEASKDVSDSSLSSEDDWRSVKEKKTSNKSTKVVRGHKVDVATPNTRSAVKAKADKGKKKYVPATTRNTRSAMKARADKGKEKDAQDELEVEVEAETSDNNKKKRSESSNKKGASIPPRKQPARVAKNCGKLNLNVEVSNEPEDSGSGSGDNQENQRSPNQGEDDNIEGTGFFEGLDEFLSSLPILNPTSDDKGAKGS